ncbi:MAG: serine protease [Rhodospirillum sp.]|nr:serine protease [Rhodospirillum sp.]MCF8490234.1 serine protease [Rhodospirillum sp.]MCF8500989.1 serine protease [Rhodospirillum sp.]
MAQQSDGTENQGSQAKPPDATPASETTTDGIAGEGSTPLSPRVVVRHSWLPVAIACAVAAVVLLILLIPGVLRYPDDTQGPAIDQALLDGRAEANRTLEERIARLRTLLSANVCVSNGAFAVPEGTTLSPEDWQALPPPAASQLPMPQTSLPPNTPAEAGSLIDYMDKAVVLVVRSDSEGRITGHGSGFVVAPNTVMTNSHVAGDLQPGDSLHVTNASMPPLQATVLSETPETSPGKPDFALLRISGDGSALRSLSLGPIPARMSHVVAAGYPGMVMETDQRFQALFSGQGGTAPAPAVTEGTVNAIQPHGSLNIVIHSAQVTPGNSGGPLVDLCGRVVGINTFIRAEQEGRLNYALDPDSLGRFIRAAGVDPSVVNGPCDPTAGGQSAPAEDGTAPSVAPSNGADATGPTPSTPAAE